VHYASHNAYGQMILSSRLSGGDLAQLETQKRFEPVGELAKMTIKRFSKAYNGTPVRRVVWLSTCAVVLP